MKLIISGGSGYVAGELIRQSLRMPEITSLVVLSRRPVTIPDHANAHKVKQVVVQDYDKYSDEAKKEFAGAAACIWTVAITPNKSRSYDADTLRHVCQTCTMAGIKAMTESDTAKPFRFMYISGAAAERDQSKAPAWLYGEYAKMRGEMENMAFAYAKEHPDKLAVQVAKPGLITSDVTMGRSLAGAFARGVSMVTSMVKVVTLQEVAAAMLAQVMKKFDQDTLSSDELQQLGRKALQP